jgi:hypothetical protein
MEACFPECALGGMEGFGGAQWFTGHEMARNGRMSRNGTRWAHVKHVSFLFPHGEGDRDRGKQRLELPLANTERRGVTHVKCDFR